VHYNGYVTCATMYQRDYRKIPVSKFGYSVKFQNQTSEDAIIVFLSKLPMATEDVVPMPHITIGHMITNHIIDKTHVDLHCLSL